MAHPRSGLFAMPIRTCRTFLTLALVGVAGSAWGQTLPTTVLRPEPTKIVLRYSAGLAADADPGVTLVVSSDVYPDLDAEVTLAEVIVTLSPEMSGRLDSAGEKSPPDAALLIIDELTVGRRVERNLIAPLPVVTAARLQDDVWNTTVLWMDYLPTIYHERSLVPDAWRVDIGGSPFPVVNVQKDLARISETQRDPVHILLIDGTIPRGAAATVSFIERPGADPRLLVSGTTAPAVARSGSLLGHTDVYTGLTFVNSQGADATFGLVTNFQQPFPIVRIGERNELSVGPRVAFRTNSSDQDDENSLLFSVPLQLTHHRRLPTFGWRPGSRAEAENLTANRPWLYALVLDVGPTFESEKTFSDGNLVANGQLDFRTRTAGTARRSGVLSGYAVDLQPYVGFEAGRNLANQVAALDDGSIGRLKLGFAGLLRVELGGPHLDQVVFDVDYVYRQLYTEEALGTRSPIEREMSGQSMGNTFVIDRGVASRTTLVGQGGSRSYLNAAIRLVFGPHWEFFASYANGELPPRFVSVDKFQAGFAFRFNSSY